MMKMSDVVYSYSKLTCFEQCSYQFFKKYVLKEEQRNSIYALAGTSTHEVIEGIQSGELTNKEALEKWKEEMNFHSFLGYEFTSEKTKTNFINSIEHFIENYKVISNDVEIEKGFMLDVEGHKLRGFIDLLIHNDDGTISIVDLKTSSKYQKRDLDKHARQLIIYTLAMEQEGFVVKDISWNMMKYCVVEGKRGKKVILRSELEERQPYEDYIVNYPLNDEVRENTKKWIVNTIEEIESKDDLFDEWKTCEGNDFYCSNLCSFCDTCEKGMEIRNRYRK